MPRSIFLAFLIAATASCAEPDPRIAVTDAWVRATPSAAAAYFTIANQGGADRLVGVDAAGTGRASLHETSMGDGIMRMRPLTDGLELPADGTVELKPMGTHVMIEELSRPLRAGDNVDLTLRFARHADLRITAEVRP